MTVTDGCQNNHTPISKLGFHSNLMQHVFVSRSEYMNIFIFFFSTNKHVDFHYTNKFLEPLWKSAPAKIWGFLDVRLSDRSGVEQEEEERFVNIHKVLIHSALDSPSQVDVCLQKHLTETGPRLLMQAFFFFHLLFFFCAFLHHLGSSAFMLGAHACGLRVAWQRSGMTV